MDDHNKETMFEHITREFEKPRLRHPRLKRMRRASQLKRREEK
jgi:hypothetical protein